METHMHVFKYFLIIYSNFLEEHAQTLFFVLLNYLYIYFKFVIFKHFNIISL